MNHSDAVCLCTDLRGGLGATGVGCILDAWDDRWELEVMATWPTYMQLNVFAFDDYFYGDTDGDGVLDRLPPNSAAPNYVNISAPPHPFISWNLVVDEP